MHLQASLKTCQHIRESFQKLTQLIHNTNYIQKISKKKPTFKKNSHSFSVTSSHGINFPLKSQRKKNFHSWMIGGLNSSSLVFVFGHMK
jgi:hypothetical protein